MGDGCGVGFGSLGVGGGGEEEEGEEDQKLLEEEEVVGFREIGG